DQRPLRTYFEAAMTDQASTTGQDSKTDQASKSRVGAGAGGNAHPWGRRAGGGVTRGLPGSIDACPTTQNSSSASKKMQNPTDLVDIHIRSAQHRWKTASRRPLTQCDHLTESDRCTCGLAWSSAKWADALSGLTGRT